MGIFSAILVIIWTPALRRQIEAIFHYAASKEIELAFVIAPITSTTFIYHSFKL